MQIKLIPNQKKYLFRFLHKKESEIFRGRRRREQRASHYSRKYREKTEFPARSWGIRKLERELPAFIRGERDQN